MFVKQVKANEAGVMYRRIGNTLYKVRVYTSQTDGETVNEKIMRLLQKEAIQADIFCGETRMFDRNSEGTASNGLQSKKVCCANFKNYGMIKTPQMSQPPERSSE